MYTLFKHRHHITHCMHCEVEPMLLLIADIVQENKLEKQHPAGSDYFRGCVCSLYTVSTMQI